MKISFGMMVVGLTSILAMGGCGDDGGNGRWDGGTEDASNENNNENNNNENNNNNSNTNSNTNVNSQASCDGLVTDTASHPMTDLQKPARFSAVTDPEFGTRIVRVTDVTSETGGDVIKTMYSTIQAFSSDESYIILYEVDNGHRLYDGRTYQFIRDLNISPADLEQVYWHPRNPDVFFYVDGNELVQYSVSQDAAAVLHTFTGCSSVSGGSDPMYISWDGQSFGLRCDDTEQAFVYRLDTNTESPRVDAPDLGPQVAPSGNNVYLEGDIYDGDMTFLRTLDLDNPFDHASLGQLIDGTDTLNMVTYDPGPGGSGVGTLVVFDLTTGQDRVIIGQDTGFPYPPSGTHISALAHWAPGWVAVSVVGDPDGQDLLHNELLLADTNSGEVCRIGHHRSHGRDGPQGYWAEPHAVISPTGTRVLFSSDWGGGSTVDTYVVELPSYVP